MGSLPSQVFPPDGLTARKDPVQCEHSSSSDCGHLSPSFLCEFLDTDLLPAFIVDLSSNTGHTQHAALHHANPALQTLTAVLAQVTSCIAALEGSDQHGAQYRPLVDWLSNARTETSRSSGINARTSLMLGDFRWTATVLGNQWAVVVATDRTSPNTSDRDVRTSVSQKAHESPGHQSNSVADGSSDTEDDAQASYQFGHVVPSGQLGNSEYLEWFRNFDWASTSLGSIQTWSPQLRQACEMMFVSPHPVALAWGADLTVLFNEAYVPIYGEMYPEIMGRTFESNWPPELYSKFWALFEDAKLTGQPILQYGQVRVFPRQGQMEESYYDIAFIPVLTPAASVAGFYCNLTDITKQVVSERRIRVLTDLTDSLASSRCLQDVWQSIIDVLGRHRNDVLFAAIYTRCSTPVPPPSATQLTLEAVVGIHENHSQLAFDSTTATRTPLGIAIDTTLDTGSVGVLSANDRTLSEEQLARLADCGITGPARNIVVYPLMADGGSSARAALVIGTSPLRPFDDDHEMFLRLVRKQCESAITVVKLIQNERALLQERAVVESEKRFMQFAEKAPVGIYMFGVDGSLKFCNKAFEGICGTPQEKIVGPMGWITLVHSDSVEETLTYWRRLINAEGPFIFELQFKRPWRPTNSTSESLDRTWGLAASYPDLSDSGELRGIYGCVVDISYVKWAEQIQSRRLSEALELKRQQENFLDITSHEIRNPLNAMSHCASELVEQINLQVAANKATGNQMAVFEDCLNMANTIAYCAKHQKRIIDDVLTVSKLDSRLLQIFPASTNPTELMTEIVTLFDAEIRASEIETSIDALQGYRELGIVEVLLDPHRVSQIIINLLSNAIKFIQREPQRLIRLSIDASSTEPANEHGGFQYVPSGAHRQDPTVGEDGNGDWGPGEIVYLTFSIRDTGPGLSDEDASLLFNRFSQASPRTHVNYGGSGLGLFISRELTEMHGGRIGLSSRSGSGTTFSFYVKCRRVQENNAAVTENTPNLSSPLRLPTPINEGIPARQSNARGSRDRAPNEGASPKAKGRVLIVEDNIVNQRLLKRLIVRNGYDASVANHGEEALAIIQSSAWRIGTQSPRFDVVLCDIEMPVMDGKTCVRRIRQLQNEGVLHPSIPVVAVTGNARTEQIRSAKESGFDTVICKPYEARELLALIEKCLISAHDSDKTR